MLFVLLIAYIIGLLIYGIFFVYCPAKKVKRRYQGRSCLGSYYILNPTATLNPVRLKGDATLFLGGAKTLDRAPHAPDRERGLYRGLTPYRQITMGFPNRVAVHAQSEGRPRRTRQLPADNLARRVV